MIRSLSQNLRNIANYNKLLYPVNSSYSIPKRFEFTENLQNVENSEKRINNAKKYFEAEVCLFDSETNGLFHWSADHGRTTSRFPNQIFLLNNFLGAFMAFPRL